MRGIFIILMISAVFASAGFLLGQSVIGWFLIGIVFQLVFNFALNRVLMVWGQNNINRLEVERLNAISKNTVLLECSNCKHVQEEEILLADKKIEYTCDECKRKNRVYVNIETAQKTILPDNEILTADIIEKMYGKIKEEDMINGKN